MSNWSIGSVESLDVSGVSPHLQQNPLSGNSDYQIYSSSFARGGLVVDSLGQDLSLSQEAVLPGISDLTIVNFDDGSRRAYYVDRGEIYGADISNDGLTLSNKLTTGIANSNSSLAWGVPDAVIMPDGRVRIYWVDDPDESDMADEVIRSATSSNSSGLSFTIDDGYRVTDGYVDFEVLRAEANDWIAIMSSSPETIPDKRQGIYMGTSLDGLAWSIDSTDIAPAGSLSYLDPTGVQLDGDFNRWKIIFSSSLSVLGDRDYTLNHAILTHDSTDSSASYLRTDSVSTSTWSDLVQINLEKVGTSSDSVIQAKQVDKSEYETGFVGSIVTGTSGNDIIRGLAGFDQLTGKAGDDLIHGGNGRDIIDGGTGSDELHGDFGWNTYKDQQDGSKDLIAIKSDQHLSNFWYGKAGNSPNGEKADFIEDLDAIDEIKIIGVSTSDISVADNVSARGVTGIGIYAQGTLEAVYTGGNLSTSQIQSMVTGDDSDAAMNNQMWSYWGDNSVPALLA